MIAILPHQPSRLEIHSQPTASRIRGALAERLSQGPSAWRSLSQLVRAGLGKVEGESLILTSKDGNVKTWPKHQLTESEVENVAVLLLAAKHIQVMVHGQDTNLIIIDRADRVLRYRLIPESAQLVKE